MLKQFMALKRLQTLALDGTLCHHALRLGLLTLKTKVSAYLAFVSWHNLSLTFIIWSSGIPHFAATRVNKKIKPLSIPM